MLKGKEVKVYDGDLIGWTTGIIIKKVDELRVKIKTKEGYELVRVLKVDSELQKDGSGLPGHSGWQRYAQNRQSSVGRRAERRHPSQNH